MDERTHVDRGGTFTDVVVVDAEGRVAARKIPSDRAVVGALCRGRLTFGTTVATNALLEGKGVKTTLLLPAGLEDLPWIGDMARPALFDADTRWPPPLCAKVEALPGRLAASGSEVEAFVAPADVGAWLDPDTRAIAIVGLHSPLDPCHERAARRWLEAACERAGRATPFVSLGHRVSPEIGLLARVETALVDAAITPILQASLEKDAIPVGALAMRSDGSLCPGRALRAPDAVLSGPAGGVLAVAHVACQGGFRRAVGLDMGGTSTDVCRLDVDDLPRREGETRVAGVRLRRPTLEVDTIAAGGGSILRNDGRRLHVGPDSAGADPGPQCYGRGGPPTLTDAALARGLVDPDAFSPPLDEGRVALPGDADEFLDLARESMAQAVRRLATQRGVDLADHALVSYGGAAGQHAAHVAARLGIHTVLVHPLAAVLSAWGQALARREEHAVRPVWERLEGGWASARRALDALSTSLPDLGPGTERLQSVDLRHLGTDHPIEVPCLAGDDADDLAARFAAAHRARFGFDRPELPVEIVNVRARVRATSQSPPAADDDPWGLGSAVVEGPRLLRAPTTAVHVPAGWRARRADGLLRLEQLAPAPPPRPDHRTPYATELWSRRFMHVAEQAGEVLRRLARSVNIRERMDFSCALFDGRGELVANAPHIPVHLGAMGETVRDLIAAVPDPDPAQVWLTNDPAAGGSHLPDLTVITPVVHDGERFFVASRAHHVDVGGSTPGSMPPRSSTLAEEGFVARRVPLLDGGRLRDLAALLAACREPETVRADLEAQIAANAHAARSLAALGPGALLARWMAHLGDVAQEAVAEVIAALPLSADGAVARDVIDGVPLALRISRSAGGALALDFHGTGGPHAGNLNAPRGVVRAAALFALRCLVGRPIPLNEGALRDVRIVAPSPSILSPPPGAAVAGGNVETSQRIVDLIFAALGARAGSQGTMNNLTLGGIDTAGARWSLYETLGGGAGARRGGHGASARQVHMTNTRATDVEVLERRFPLRVRGFALRPKSGGAGRWRGGDGLVREIELLAPATAALLATRREDGAAGLAGGEPGAPGAQSIDRGGGATSWSGKAVALDAGARIRVETPGGGGYRPADDGALSP